MQNRSAVGAIFRFSIDWYKCTAHKTSGGKVFKRATLAAILWGLAPVTGASAQQVFEVNVHGTIELGLAPHVRRAIREAEIESQNLTIAVPAQSFPWGRSAYLRDPDGRLVELSERGQQ